MIVRVACFVFVNVQVTSSPSFSEIVIVRVPRFGVCVPPFGSTSVQARLGSANPPVAASVQVYVVKFCMPVYVCVFDNVGSPSSSSENDVGVIVPPVAENEKF